MLDCLKKFAFHDDLHLNWSAISFTWLNWFSPSSREFYVIDYNVLVWHKDIHSSHLHVPCMIHLKKLTFRHIGIPRNRIPNVIGKTNFQSVEFIPLPWSSVHWLVQCTLECHWLTQCTLEYHWKNLVETAPHWNATGETLTFAAYTGTPLDGLWQPTHALTHIIKHAE